MKPMLRRATMRMAATLPIILLLTASACISHTTRQTEDRPIAELSKNGKGSIIHVTDEMIESGGSDTVRFGHLHSGEIAVLSLWLANETEHPIVLSDYRRSCGCTTLEFTVQPISPNRARQLPLTFDSRGEWGWQLKTIDLLFSGSEHSLRLFIEAEVE